MSQRTANWWGGNEPEDWEGYLYLSWTPAGAKSWNQMAYSPRTGWIYTPSLEVCSDLVAGQQEAVEGGSFFGGNFIMKPPPNGPRGAMWMLTIR